MFLKAPAATWLTAASLLLPAWAHASPGLVSARDCLSCHEVDRTFNGPSFRQISARYKGDATAQERLTKKILTGGSGQWGANNMPPQVISESDARKVVQWILTLK
ncbi:MAG: c-type cytochrome [Pseudomonadota bacterium]